MAVRFYNRAKMTVAQAPNTGTFVLDEAAEGFQDFADAGVTHGVQIRYAAEQGNNWEFGTSTVSLVDGVYSIPRNPEKSSNLDNSAIIFDSNTEVFASMDAADVVQSIEDLIDVSSSAPNSGDFLRWDGGSWAPQFGSTTYTIQDGELSERNFTHALKGKLDDIEVQADVTDTANVVASLTAGTNVTIASDGTISSTDTNTTYTAAELLTAVKTVDGAASGLDADLLDGQQGSYYTGYADTAVANIVDSSPNALNTLNELAAALGDDANFSTTVTNNIAEKLPLAGGTMTGALDMGSNNVTTTGKILYSNVYSAEVDLPSASTYHGMFAHVHGTGKGYFAHGGNWIKLANYDDIGTSYTHPDHTGEVTSLADGATVIADNVVDEANLKVSNAPTNGYVLTAQSANAGGLTWAEASTGGGLGGGSSYANITSLSAATGMSAGDIALVTSSNKVYMYNGSGWFLLATLSNASPTAITGVSGSYSLATDGTATVVTAVSSDPDGFPLTWSYAVTTGSLTNGGGTTATVSQADNVFTITPSTNESYTGQFSITFSATDGGQSGTVSAVSAFTLGFNVPNSRYNALLVKATNTGSNQTFDDASASNHTITVAGDTTASTFSPYRHGGYSAYFTTSGSTSGSGGTGQYIQSDLTSELTLDTNDFTISCWVYGISKLRNYPRILQIGPQNTPWAASQLAIAYKHDDDNDSIALAMNGIGGNGLLIASGPINDNQWYHVALTRSGSTFTLYIDGVSVGTYTSTGSATGTGNKAIQIGGASSGDSDFHGYIADVRVINGTAIYAGNFTPPTEPATVVTNTKFLLGNLPYFKDQSASNHAITPNDDVSLKPKSVFDNAPYSKSSHGASAYFDGTGDYISAANHADFNFGSGNFTIESYVYYTPKPTANQVIVAQWHTGGGNNRRAFQLRRNFGTPGSFRFYWSTDGSDYPYITTESTGIDLNTMHNQWIHVAVVRNGNTITMYVNGTDVVNTTLTGSLYDNTTDDIFIGSRSVDPPNIDHQTGGYISDVRILNGTAAYTSNFIPPTAPLTAITNTKFLLNPDASIIDKSQGVNLKLVNTTGSTTQVKFSGTKSIYTGGNSTSLIKLDANEDLYNLSYGEGDFTVEGWFYTTDNTNNPKFYIDITSTGTYWQLYYISGSGITLRANAYGIYSTETGDSFTENTWHHIAVCRSGSNYKVFHNGTGIIDVTSTHQIGSHSSKTIGGTDYSTGNNLRGYIQDFRITKGLARYTANFTPPTAELEG